MNACMHVYGMYVVLASTNIAVTLRACMYIYGARGKNWAVADDWGMKIKNTGVRASIMPHKKVL